MARGGRARSSVNYREEGLSGESDGDDDEDFGDEPKKSTKPSSARKKPAKPASTPKKRKKAAASDSDDDEDFNMDDGGMGGSSSDLDSDIEIALPTKKNSKKGAAAAKSTPTPKRPKATKGKTEKPKSTAKKPAAKKQKTATGAKLASDFFGTGATASTGATTKAKAPKAKASKNTTGTAAVKVVATKADLEAAKIQVEGVKQGTRLSMISRERKEVPAEQGMSLSIAVASCTDREFKVSQGLRRKHQRLFVLPGQISLQGIGTCGTIENFASNEPILNIDFPEEKRTLKMYGSLVSPESSYLLVNFDEREKQGVTLDADYEEVVVFTSYEWVDTAGRNTTTSTRQPTEMIDWNDPKLFGQSYKSRTLSSVVQDDAKSEAASESMASRRRRASAGTNYVSEESEDEDDNDDDSEDSGPVATPERRQVSRRSAAQSALKALHVDDSNDDDDDDDDNEDANNKDGDDSPADEVDEPVEIIDDDDDDDYTE